MPGADQMALLFRIFVIFEMTAVMAKLNVVEILKMPAFDRLLQPKIRLVADRFHGLQGIGKLRLKFQFRNLIALADQ